ncbi:hypothetical protein NPIL_410521 [Nephila pilipes]|uniref:Uncharacterized protein n=1 Tax=Nephila pilipes TaxID=299642 RepID=A0A8X6PRH2_NEPPI|nr:hypothetical protein NPIL_410521 [Nephila pilipes]
MGWKGEKVTHPENRSDMKRDGSAVTDTPTTLNETKQILCEMESSKQIKRKHEVDFWFQGEFLNEHLQVCCFRRSVKRKSFAMIHDKSCIGAGQIADPFTIEMIGSFSAGEEVELASSSYKSLQKWIGFIPRQKRRANGTPLIERRPHQFLRNLKSLPVQFSYATKMILDRRSSPIIPQLLDDNLNPP